MANKFSNWLKAQMPWNKEEGPKPDAYYNPPGSGYSIGQGGGYTGTVWSTSYYDGSKSLGGAGPIVNNLPDFQALNIRGWQAALTNPAAITTLGKMAIWTIGSGLKLEAIPNTRVLKSEGIDLEMEEAQDISDIIEARFDAWASSEDSSFSGESNFYLSQADAYNNILHGGCVLCVIRYVDNCVKLELIDAAHIQSPLGGTELSPMPLENGNRMIGGVEVSPRGKHVRYHVRQADATFLAIEAYSESTGLRTAFLAYEYKYRLDYVKGIPTYSGVFELIASLDRYRDATLQSAEEQNKLAYQGIHDVNAVGEDPMGMQGTAQAMGYKSGKIPLDTQRAQMVDKVQATTKRQYINNAPGTKVEPIGKNEAELYFKDFHNEIFDAQSSAVLMPPNIARGKYDTSYSAARAAKTDGEHTFNVKRDIFSFRIFKPVYEFWLHMEVLKNKIQLPGYLEAHASGNKMVLNAYRKFEAVGENMGHIDPLKETMAIREQMGPGMAHVPLITAERGARELGGGDYRSIWPQAANEAEEAEEAGLKPEPIAPAGAAPGKKAPPKDPKEDD